MTQPRARAVDYLLLGHVCLDRTAGGETPGGTVLYASRAALGLGLRTAVVTAAPDPARVRVALPGVQVAVQPAATWTRFENIYTGGGRRQTSSSQGPPIDPAGVPADWLETAAAVHYAPVAQEIAPLPLPRRPGRIAGLTAQGLSRRFEPGGRVAYQPPALTDAHLAALDAIVVSEEDVQGDLALAEGWARAVPVVVVTQGECGGLLWDAGRRHEVPVDPIETDDPTGAGDLFATVLFVSLAAGLPAVDAVGRAARFVADVLGARASGQAGTAIEAAAARYRVVTPPRLTGYNPGGSGQRERGSG